MIKTDVLIIGSGIAGLNYALHLMNKKNIVLMSKSELKESNTWYAQGGIAAVMSPKDSFASHIKDTLDAGEGLCDKKAVSILSRSGPREIRRLIGLNVKFTKNEKNALDMTEEAAHSHRRILHSGDLTGREIESKLIKAFKERKKNTKKKVQVLENCFAVELIVNSRRCIGCVFYHKEKINLVLAKTIVLATGGAGALYSFSSNPPGAAGDGIALGFRSGARLSDLEFVQFHPTIFYTRRKQAQKFLISEAVRGEGGVLKDSSGIRFMPAYHKLAELAARHIVAQAIYNEIKGSDKDHVFLDVTHLDKDFIRKRFPNIYKTCKEYGVDITNRPIPVKPGAHYMCGGIVTDRNGQTSIPGLYAIGEVACTGVHGANRLASNSLMEALVFGRMAAEHSLKYILRSSRKIEKEQSGIKEEIFRELYNGLQVDMTSGDKKLKRQLQDIMMLKVGIVRTQNGLKQAQKELDDIYSKARSVKMQNMALAASLIAESALMRKESRGSHLMKEFPRKQKPKHIDIVLTG